MAGSVTVPPAITIEGTDTHRAYVESAMQAMIRLADDLANQAVRLHDEIEFLLKSEGIDGPSGLFNTGSSANATANGYVKLAQRAASQAESAGTLLRALHQYWVKNIKNPVDAARASRSRSSGRKPLSV